MNNIKLIYGLLIVATALVVFLIINFFNGGKEGKGSENHANGIESIDSIDDKLTATPTANTLGDNLFNDNCTQCHTIGQGRLIGPDLMGVTERRNREWLYAFIRNSTEMRKSGDPDAVALFDEYNKTEMTAFTSLSDEELDALCSYIEYRSGPIP